MLSPSTEDYDRGEKLGNYKQIPSLLEVVLVAHDRPEVEVVRREADGSWSRHIARDSGAVRLESIACELLVAEIYLIRWPPAETHLTHELFSARVTWTHWARELARIDLRPARRSRGALGRDLARVPALRGAVGVACCSLTSAPALRA